MNNEQTLTQKPRLTEAISSIGLHSSSISFYSGTSVRMTLTPEGNFSIVTIDDSGNQLTPLVNTTADHITKVFGRGSGLLIWVDGVKYRISFVKRVNPLFYPGFSLFFVSKTPQAIAEKRKWLQAFSDLQQPNIAIARDRTIMAILVGLAVGFAALVLLIAWVFLFYAKP